MRTHFLFSIILLVLLSSCATVSIPVLRHETGETLGLNAKNLAVKAETSRALPTPPTQSGTTYSSTQESNPLQSAIIGINIKYGIMDNLDLKLDAPFFTGGGGWRFNAKYQLLGTSAAASAPGNFAGSAMISFGKFASRGEVTYNTGSSTTSSSSTSTDSTAAEATYFQNLSATSIEFSFPFSIKVSEGFLIYSGIFYSILKADGNISTELTEFSTSDLGFNLGIQNKIDTILLNIEGMMLKADNPFTGLSAFEAYFGLSAGISF